MPLPIAPPLVTEMIVVPSDGNIFTTPITDPMVVGRAEGHVDILLSEPWIGRRHVRFTWTARGLEVLGLGPGSGTWLREQRIDGEEPADDDARLVYADWLADRDPVRSEFIACQIAAARGSAAAAARAAELECIALVAPLAVPVESWTFERGLLATARILHGVAAEQLRADHPGLDVRAISFPPPPLRR